MSGKRYDENAMVRAMYLVQHEKKSYNSAAAELSVPRSTLREHCIRGDTSPYSQKVKALAAEQQAVVDDKVKLSTLQGLESKSDLQKQGEAGIAEETEIDHQAEDITLAKAELEKMTDIKQKLEMDIANYKDEIWAIKQVNQGLSEQLAAVVGQLEQSKTEVADRLECTLSELSHLKEEKKLVEENLQQATQQLVKYKKVTSDELERASATCNTQQSVMTAMQAEIDNQKKQTQTLTQERLHAISELTDQRAKNLLREIHLEHELREWKTMCRELQAKIELFQEQLDMFEIEKKALLKQNTDAQSDLVKLSAQYTKLLGHQDQKQNIDHIMKLKEENLTLKKENRKLNEQLLKMKIIIFIFNSCLLLPMGFFSFSSA